MPRFRFLVQEPENNHYYTEDGTTWEARTTKDAKDQLDSLNANLAHNVIMIDIEEKERQEMK